MIWLQLCHALALAVVVGMPIGQGLRGWYPAEDIYPAENLYPTGA